MLNQILTNTPRWVWILLLALLWLGFSQTVTRRVSLKKITMMPLAMAALSLYSTVSAFGGGGAVLLTWLSAAALTLMLVLLQALPDGVQYDRSVGGFTLPGSWIPLTLIMGIFLLKYALGALAVVQPSILRQGIFSLCVTAMYGGFSGVFMARAARLWRLVK